MMKKYVASLGLSLVVFLAGCAHTSLERVAVASLDAPAAIGPYSQAIQVGETIWLSGQIAIDPSTSAMVEGGIEAQTHQVLKNARAVLEAANFSLKDVVQSQVFLADLDDYAAMNAVYAEYFTGAPPARAAVQVARLPLDARVEIMLTAVRGASR